MHAHVPVPLDVRAAAPSPGDNQTAPARLAPSTPGSLPDRCRGAPAIARRQSANAQDAPPPARASPHLARAQLPRRGDPRPALPPAQGPDPLAHLSFPLTRPPPLASRWPSPPSGSSGPPPPHTHPHPCLTISRAPTPPVLPFSFSQRSLSSAHSPAPETPLSPSEARPELAKSLSQACRPCGESACQSVPCDALPTPIHCVFPEARHDRRRPRREMLGGSSRCYTKLQRDPSAAASSTGLCSGPSHSAGSWRPPHTRRNRIVRRLVA